MEIRHVGIVGLGTMGAGITEVAARAGLTVTAVEADPAALDRGLALLDRSLGRAVAKGKLTQDDKARIDARVNGGCELASLADADLVIEVVPEQLAVKHQVIARLDQVCRPGAIFATNTSSLSVTAIAAGSAHPGRVAGLHFFNPAPVMRLVEVVTTVLTDEATGQAVTELATALGKTPVRVSDRAGFVANALLLPYLNHAARLLETGYASREDIDEAAVSGLGLPMGPLALLDLIGLDTCLAILQVLQHEFGGTRYTPAPLLRRLADSGRTGRKGGAGFYDYPPQGPAPASGSSGLLNADLPPAPGTVTLIDPPGGPGGALAADLASTIAAAGINVTRSPAHSTELAIVAIGPQAGVLGPALAAGRAADTVGIHLAAGNLAELVVTPLTSQAALASARSLLVKLGLRVVRSPDRAGLLVGALLYPHARDAVAMVADGYASAADVETAMTLGCGYPRGPLALLADAGLDQAVRVLRGMHETYGDPAFAPPPLLTEYAAAGLTL